MSALSFVYFIVIMVIDPRLADGSLYWNEMYIYEIPIFLMLFLGVCFLWLKGMYSCFRAGKMGKAILCFMVWPYSVYLALTENSGAQLDETT